MSLPQKARGKSIPLDDMHTNRTRLEAAQLVVLLGDRSEVEDKLDLPRNTLNNWYNHKSGHFKSLVEKFADTLYEEMKFQLVGAAKNALRVSKEIMEDRTVEPNVRLKAAQDIMDRAGFSPKKHQQLDINSTVNYFSNMPDDELDKIIDIQFEDVENGERAERATSVSEDREAEKSVLK